jgi:folate-binding protein YgfZ
VDREGPEVSWAGSRASVRVGERRYLELQPSFEKAYETTAAESAWTLQEILAGRPFITAATHDQFVPQMVKLEKVGGIDFHKGCYPGQEIVACQYRGEVKRRMVRCMHLQESSFVRTEFNGGWWWTARVENSSPYCRFELLRLLQDRACAARRGARRS